MYKTSIRFKIMAALLGMVILTLSIFSFYALNEVRKYSERHFTVMLFNYAKHSEHIVNSHYGSDRYKWISLLLPNSEQTRHMNIEIINESGAVIFASNKHISPFNQKNFPEIKQAFAGQEGLATRNNSGGEKFFY
ncbi:MAG: hypothetical protein LBO03_01275, partial [Acidaminococcales bacterium]|nr:hypothetical protein [Acidaminococcales bacterium]